MPTIYFVRHGEADYSERDQKIYRQFGTNLAPLSPAGIRQIQQTAQNNRLRRAQIILSSPYTRALQSAAILSRALDLEIAVETDLHEWLSNRDYRFDTDAAARQNHQAYQQFHGVHPDDTCTWESAQQMRERVLAVLRKYTQHDTIIVAGHGMMMQAVTGGQHAENGEIVAFEL